MSKVNDVPTTIYGYLGLLWKTAFPRAWALFETLTLVFSFLAWVASRQWEHDWTDWSWIGAIGIATLVFVGRLLAAPYLIHQQMAERIRSDESARMSKVTRGKLNDSITHGTTWAQNILANYKWHVVPSTNEEYANIRRQVKDWKVFMSKTLHGFGATCGQRFDQSTLSVDGDSPTMNEMLFALESGVRIMNNMRDELLADGSK